MKSPPKPRAVVGLQCRMGSSRLPGKTLKEICGKPLIQRVWEALGDRHLRVALIPDTEENDVLAAFLRRHKMLYRRDSEPNPLMRYYNAALEWNPRVLVRVCGDAPFLRPEWINAAVDAAMDGPVFAPGVLHAGPCSAWDRAFMHYNGVDEHAGHDWFREHGKHIGLDWADISYFTVNTAEELERARGRFA